jgi:hypothetical protein
MFKKTGGDLLKFNLAQGRDILQYNNEITEIEEKNLPLIERGSRIESLSGLFKSNLNQGKQMLDFNSEETNDLKPDLSLIEKGSIVESIGNMNLNASDKSKLEGLSNIENDYNQLLAEFSQTYKQFSEDLLNQTQTKKQIVDTLGKVISDTDGNNYYVNNFGYTHKYSTSAWQNNNSSCPSTTMSYSGDFNNFKTGPAMTSGQPCKIAGQIVKNTSSGETAWVDIKGMKHPFSGAKSNSCSSTAIELNSDDYNLIPTGSAMSSSDTCLALDVNPTLYNKLQSLNGQIKLKANQLVSQMNSLNLSNSQAQNSLNNKRNNMMKQVNHISDLNKEVIYNNRMLMQVGGESDDASLRMTSSWYILIAWIFITILIVSLAMASSTGIGGKPVSGIAYVIVAFGVLMFLIYLYKKVSSVSIQVN